MLVRFARQFTKDDAQLLQFIADRIVGD